MLPGSLVKLNVSRCFTGACGGKRLKPISNSWMDKQGFVVVRSTRLVRGQQTDVVLKKGHPYFLVGVRKDEYHVTRKAKIMDSNGEEFEIEFAWLEPY